MRNTSFSIVSDRPIHNGLPREACSTVAQALANALANTEVLFMKTQFYHWNVTGINFYSLHKLFEKQYRQLQETGDLIAERIRALGCVSPGTFREFSELSDIEEDANLPGSWQTMVTNLIKCHEICSESCHEVLDIADEQEDEVTADMMIDAMKFHDKSAWMLRSILQGEQELEARAKR